MRLTSAIFLEDVNSGKAIFTKSIIVLNLGLSWTLGGLGVYFIFKWHKQFGVQTLDLVPQAKYVVTDRINWVSLFDINTNVAAFELKKTIRETKKCASLNCSINIWWWSTWLEFTRFRHFTEKWILIDVVLSSLSATSKNEPVYNG